MEKRNDELSIMVYSSVRITLSKEGIVQDKLTIGGIIAFSLIILQAFISFRGQELDLSATISMAGFALGIPLLAVYISLCDHLEIEDPIPAPLEVICIYSIGLLSAVVGMAAAFWHLSGWLGLLFLGSSFVGMWVIANHVIGKGTLRKNSRYTKRSGDTLET